MAILTAVCVLFESSDPERRACTPALPVVSLSQRGGRIHGRKTENTSRRQSDFVHHMVLMRALKGSTFARLSIL